MMSPSTFFACVLLHSGFAALASAQLGSVRSEQKIGQFTGGFGGDLDEGDSFGRSVARLGDLDGDGFIELAVGAPFDDGPVGSISHGAVWILTLNQDGTVRSEQKIDVASSGLAGGLAPGDGFGTSVAALGDLDGDGTGDLAVGAPGFGAVWILFLAPDGTAPRAQKISEEDGGFGGTLDGIELFGSSVACVGDLDGDGLPELAVGADQDSDGGFAIGSIWILFLNADGTVAAEQKVSKTQGGFGVGLDVGDRFGRSLAPIGDLNGDGTPDLAVGAYQDDDGGTSADQNRGAVWILFLNADGTVGAKQKISEASGGFGGSLANTDFFGSSAATLDDMDGDGVPELAVGARGVDGLRSDQGAVWILFLNADGTVKSELKIDETSGGFGGGLNFRVFFGDSVAALDDLDGDGNMELAVGAPGSNGPGPGIDHGAVWILFLQGPCTRLDFETEDDLATALVNGQDISTPPEFGRLVWISGSGPNAGAAIFDSTPGGPNDPSQDRDLLVGGGNMLILQTDANTTQTVPGVFDRPNDDEDGGTLSFAFASPVELLRLDLIDIDSGADEASLVVLTDLLGRQRSYLVPPEWTGDLLEDGTGRLTLDLNSQLPKPGFASTTSVAQDLGFASSKVISLEVHLGSSGAIDNIVWCSPDRLGRGPGPRPNRTR